MGLIVVMSECPTREGYLKEELIITGDPIE